MWNTVYISLVSGIYTYPAYIVHACDDSGIHTGASSAAPPTTQPAQSLAPTESAAAAGEHTNTAVQHNGIS